MPKKLHHRLAQTFRVSILGLAALAAACGDDTAPGSRDSKESDEKIAASSLRFVPGETLQLAPGAPQELQIQVLPEAFHAIDLSIASVADAASFDGFLDHASVVTDETGLARTILTAPSQPTVFIVRANVGGELFANQVVSVSSDGFGTIEVVPRYSGRRTVSTWTASVRLDTTCAGIDNIWSDEPLAATGSETVALNAVPVGPSLAVILRSGQFASGCANVPNLAAAESLRLFVDVSDRPLRLEGTVLGLSLSISETTTEYSELLDAALSAGLAAFASNTEHDSEILLEDMANAIASSDDRAAFLQAQTEYLAVIKAQLPMKDALYSEVEAALLDAAHQLASEPSLDGRLEFGDTELVYVLEEAGGIPAALSGFLGGGAWTVETQPNDAMLISGEFVFEATRWLAAVADASAQEGSSPVERLSAVTDCNTLGANLASSGGGDVYPGCDRDCAELLCESAVTNGWLRAATGAGTLTTLRAAISAGVEVNDDAYPVLLEGSWLGVNDDGRTTVGGSAQGDAQ